MEHLEGLTRIIILEAFGYLIVEAGGYRQRVQISEPGPSRELLNQSRAEEESEIFLSRGRVYQNVTVIFTAFQKHLNIGRHKLKLAKESAFDESKRK